MKRVKIKVKVAYVRIYLFGFAVMLFCRLLLFPLSLITSLADVGIPIIWIHSFFGGGLAVFLALILYKKSAGFSGRTLLLWSRIVSLAAVISLFVPMKVVREQVAEESVPSYEVSVKTSDEQE